MFHSLQIGYKISIQIRFEKSQPIKVGKPQSQQVGGIRKSQSQPFSGKEPEPKRVAFTVTLRFKSTLRFPFGITLAI